MLEYLLFILSAISGLISLLVLFDIKRSGYKKFLITLFITFILFGLSFLQYKKETIKFNTQHEEVSFKQVDIGMSKNIHSNMYKYNIRQMVNTTTINGNFFLGCGSIEQSPVYYAYIVTENGGLKLIEMPCHLTNIYEDATIETACILECQEEYNVHVPPNSIASNIDLGLDK